MAHFIEIQKKALKISPQRIANDFFKFVRTLESKMADFNREQLNKESADVFGNPLGFYSRATEQLSDGRKIFGEPFDLFDTGVFLPTVFARVLNNGIMLFGATDPKTDEVLQNLLTRDVFGLSDTNLEKLIRADIVPFLQNYYAKYIFNV